MDESAERDYQAAVELIRDRQKRLRAARSAKQLVSQVLSRHGVAASQESRDLAEAWQSVATEFAEHTRVGRIQRGKLDVFVSGSTMLQHLTFEKQKILDALRKELPHMPIQDLRLKVAPIGRRPNQAAQRESRVKPKQP